MQITGDQVAWEMELGLIPRQIIPEPVSFRHHVSLGRAQGAPVSKNETTNPPYRAFTWVLSILSPDVCTKWCHRQ